MRLREQRADRAGLDPHDFGDLAVREVAVIAKHHAITLPPGKPAQRPVQRVVHGRGRGGGALEAPLELRRKAVSAGSPPLGVRRRAQNESPEPRLERALAPPRGALSNCEGECVLYHVARRFATGDRRGEPAEARSVSSVGGLDLADRRTAPARLGLWSPRPGLGPRRPPRRCPCLVRRWNCRQPLPARQPNAPARTSSTSGSRSSGTGSPSPQNGTTARTRS